MEKKDKELAFSAMTAAIVIMLVYALNLFGAREMGIWIGAIAFAGYAIGYLIFEEAEKTAGKNAGWVIGTAAFCALLAAYFTQTGGASIGVYAVFLVFALVFGAGKAVRKLMLGGEKEHAQPNKP